MQKIKYFILILIMLATFNISIDVYAEQKFISVGLTKYNNTTTLSIDNKEIMIGKNNNNLFNSELTLTTSNNFIIKSINTYSIKYNNTFYNYNEALNFSKTYKDSYIYKDDNWYVMIGNFKDISSANDFMYKENISGQAILINNSIGIYENNNIILAFKDSMAIKSNENISISNKQYRNIINILCKNNSFTIINILDIEDYLYSVVPSEIPPSWHKEALKAQSVAARNYAYSNLGLHKNEGFDVCDTIHCQVYNGVSNETNTTNQAVDETKGILAYYNNEKINAVYFSSSGGYTEYAENVWNDSIPYLKAVKDEFEEEAKQWTRTFTFDELSKVASVGNVNEIILESSSITGRANTLTIVGTNGKKVLKKEEIRTFFSKFNGGSLDSKNFKIVKGNTINNTTNKSTYVMEVVNNTIDDTEVYLPQISNQDIDINTNQNISKTKNLSINKINLYDNNIYYDNIYVISSKNNSLIDKENTFFIDKSQLVSKFQFNNNDETNKNPNTPNNNNSNIPNDKPINEPTTTSKVTRQDSNSVTFIGKGWGHGVGLSQYGANSLAKKGYKYDEILKYYYKGIEVR